MTWVQKSVERGRGDSSNRQGLSHFSLLLGDHEHPRPLLTLVVRMTLAPAARIILMRSLVMSNSRSRIFSSSLGSVTRTCRTHKCGCQHHNGRWMTPHKALMRPGLLPSEMSACHPGLYPAIDHCMPSPSLQGGWRCLIHLALYVCLPTPPCPHIAGQTTPALKEKMTPQRPAPSCMARPLGCLIAEAALTKCHFCYSTGEEGRGGAHPA